MFQTYKTQIFKVRLSHYAAVQFIMTLDIAFHHSAPAVNVLLILNHIILVGVSCVIMYFKVKNRVVMQDNWNLLAMVQILFTFILIVNKC